jgi:hypothetical protein
MRKARHSGIFRIKFRSAIGGNQPSGSYASQRNAWAISLPVTVGCIFSQISTALLSAIFDYLFSAHFVYSGLLPGNLLAGWHKGISTAGSTWFSQDCRRGYLPA